MPVLITVRNVKMTLMPQDVTLINHKSLSAITTPGTLRTSPGKPLPKPHLVTSAPNPMSNVTGKSSSFEKFPESNTYNI